MTGIADIINQKYGPRENWGWGTRLRARFAYNTPDDWYEALLLDTVGPATRWLDVGCGRTPFPQNPVLARRLSEECSLLVGLDPSENIESNPYLHERVRLPIEDYRPDRQFHLVTLRMVAEHIRNPVATVSALSGIAAPGGLVVIYTVWKWAPASIAAAATPMWVHHRAKKLLWNSEERDTFPVVYKMNTRRDLQRLFAAAGFEEESFEFLDDCRSSHRSKIMNTAELYLRTLCRKLGFRYPEACILATYRKDQ